MLQKHFQRIIKWLLIIGIGSWVIFGGQTFKVLTAPEITWSRNHDPVVFKGEDVPMLTGYNTNEIYAYRYLSGEWEQIPFQIDEITVDGDYAVEDGILDLNDELVFMAMDLGDVAGPTDWIANQDARDTIRYQLTITNPLNTSEVGYVYLHHSSSLTPSFGDYVAWYTDTNTINAESYILGLKPTEFFGLDSLELNGSGSDMLDRSKVRVNALCNGISFPINEATLVNFMDMSLTPEIDGSVRVGGGNSDSNFWAYYSIYDIKTMFDFNAISVPICFTFSVDWLRFSFDLLDPVDSGMAPVTYYDSNSPGGYIVDGVNDTVPTSPLNSWVEINGEDGSKVQMIDVSVGGGTVTNYYKDDSGVDGNDTGDQKSFADSGVRIDNPTGIANLRFTDYILGADQQTVGATYRNLYDNPLVMTTQPQTIHDVYIPLVLR